MSQQPPASQPREIMPTISNRTREQKTQDDRVVLTGAAGFFGLALTRTLALAGYSVTAVDRMPSAEFCPRQDTPMDRVRYLNAEITDPAQALALPAGAGTVLHAAALTPTAQQQLQEPDRIVAVNLGATLALLEAVRRTPGCRRFVFISSAGVFDQRLESLLSEEDATGSTSLYGATKLASETMVRQYGRLFGLETLIVRPTSLYGPGERERASRPVLSQVFQLVQAARQSTPVRLAGLSARCDWLYVDDAAEAVSLLMARPYQGDHVFNLSSSRARPFSELVEAVNAVLPLRVEDDAEVLIDGGSDRPATIANQRLRAATGWTPGPLEEGIHRYVATTHKDRDTTGI